LEQKEEGRGGRGGDLHNHLVVKRDLTQTKTIDFGQGKRQPDSIGKGKRGLLIDQSTQR